jgi:hypothetical protein
VLPGQVASIGKLLGLVCNGGQDLHQRAVTLAVLELVHGLHAIVELLLDEAQHLSVKGHLGVRLLEETAGLKKTLEKTAGLSDYLGSLIVLVHLLLELFLLLSSGCVGLINLRLNF